MKLIDSNRYYLHGQDRFIHVATVHDIIYTYICMVDKLTQKCYIEELNFLGQLIFIEDDKIVKEVNKFLVDKGVLNLVNGLATDIDDAFKT